MAPVPASGQENRVRHLPLFAGTVAAVALAGGAVAALVLFGPWRGIEPPPAAAFSRAYTTASSLKSVHVVEDTTTNRLHFGPQVVIAPMPMVTFPLSEGLEYANCVESPPSLRECKVVEKATGKVVGEQRSTGGRRVVEWDYVFPDKAYAQVRQMPDHKIAQYPEEYEHMCVGEKRYERQPGVKWHPVYFVSPAQATCPRIGLALLKDEYDTVQRLPDERLSGVPVRHYRAYKKMPGGFALTVNVWIAKKTWLPLKIETYEAYEEGPEAGSFWRRTITFSRFNEPLEIPTPPP